MKSCRWMRGLCFLAVGLASQLAAATLGAAEVRVAVGLFLPPYVIADEWRGMEYDIVRRALELEGHTIVPQPTYLARVAKDLEHGAVDAAMPVQVRAGAKEFYSEPHIQYQNFAITLRSSNLELRKIGDLAGRSVVAFQEASRYLGPEFEAMAKANPNYREEAKQVVQPILLFHGRTEVVVADRYIFNWFAASPEVRQKVDVTQPLRFHPLFPPTDYRVAFRDEGLRDAFNRGLKRLRDSGEYQRIMDNYDRTLTAALPK
ncbi:substrate-binding periplasmic protein [Magnetospirillum moscoviense]|nr:transporter substrate-binding domain-containing protein [Magnetospirillum moscoviense]MBF0325272.1 transporter substrate-binding domain-containing protein [Alphaproteobacteria bacterium]